MRCRRCGWKVGAKPTTRKVDKLSCIRFGSARYSVPNALIGTTVRVLVDEQARSLRVISPVTGEIHAEHRLVAPGEVSILDAHYDRPRPDTHVARHAPGQQPSGSSSPWVRVAEEFLTGAAAAGVTKLGTETTDILRLHAAHGTEPLVAALERAVAFGRWRTADVRSILATGGHAPRPTPAGQALLPPLLTRRTPRSGAHHHASPRSAPPSPPRPSSLSGRTQTPRDTTD